MNAPCLNCEDREIGCHGKCEKYQKYREFRLEISRQRFIERPARETVVEGIMQRRKKRRKDHKG